MMDDYRFSMVITDIQRKLRSFGIDVDVDGYIGPKTYAAISKALDQLQELRSVATASLMSEQGAISNHPDMAPLVRPLVWGAKVSPEFRRIVRDIAMELGCDPNWLMACMAFETARTFSPSVKNPHSSGTGLIQFMGATAIGLGTTVDKLALMTAEQQLDIYVRKYFKPFAGRIKNLEDMYMAIIWPVAVGKPNDYEMWTLATRPRQYNANSALDKNGDHVVTKYEASTFPRAALFDGAEFLA
jgi:hypothetical protein